MEGYGMQLQNRKSRKSNQVVNQEYLQQFFQDIRPELNKNKKQLQKQKVKPKKSTKTHRHKQKATQQAQLTKQYQSHIFQKPVKKQSLPRQILGKQTSTQPPSYITLFQQFNTLQTLDFSAGLLYKEMLEQIVLGLIDKQLQWDLVAIYLDSDNVHKDKDKKLKQMLDQLQIDQYQQNLNLFLINKFHNTLGQHKLLSKVPYKAIVTLMLVNYLTFIIKSTETKVFQKIPKAFQTIYRSLHQIAVQSKTYLIEQKLKKGLRNVEYVNSRFNAFYSAKIVKKNKYEGPQKTQGINDQYLQMSITSPSLQNNQSPQWHPSQQIKKKQHTKVNSKTRSNLQKVKK